MTIQPLKSKTLVIFLALLLAPAAFGDEDEDYVASAEFVESPTRSAPPRAPLTMAEMTRELDASQVARDTLNRTLRSMQRKMKRILQSAQPPVPVPVPAPSGVNNVNNVNNSPNRREGRGFSVQTNYELFERLEREVQALKSTTVGNPRAVTLNNEPATPPLGPGLPALQTELHDLSTQVEAMKTENEENTQLLRGDLNNLTESVKDVLAAGKVRNRQEMVKDVLQAFSSSQNARVHSLLNDLTESELLDSVILDIVRGMFGGSVQNYKKIIDVFQSAKREQFEAGLTSLIDLFHSGGVGNLPVALEEQPQYLHLAYLTKDKFGTELKAKFPTLVQNLVWNPKNCIWNINTVQHLIMDRTKGLKDGGYPVSTKKPPLQSPGLYCDWEILSGDESTSFQIRQNVPNTGGGAGGRSSSSFMNLNVLDRSVYAGTDLHNPHYFWRIQLRNNSEALTLQNVPASSDKPSFFLCSAAGTSKTKRAVELRSSGEGKYCSWFVQG